MNDVDFDDLELDESNVHFWQGKRFTGIAIERFSSGVVRCKIPFENGEANGVSKEWFESNAMKAETRYLNGAKHGLSRQWYESGSVKEDAVFELGICTSVLSWKENGMKEREFKLDITDPLYGTLEILRSRT